MEMIAMQIDRAFLLHFMQTKRKRDSFFEFALVVGGAFF